MKFPFSLLAGCSFSFVALTGSISHAEVLAKPYVQPGPLTTLTDHDEAYICWVTDNSSDESFKLTYHFGDKSIEAKQEKQTLIQLISPKPDRPEDKTYPPQDFAFYRAKLEQLPLNADIDYELTDGTKPIRKAAFHTRKPPGNPIDFFVLGDIAFPSSQKFTEKVAYQIGKQTNDFGIGVGDIAYMNGRVHDYLDKFAPAYINTDEPAPLQGSGILARVPFYVIIGNHEIRGSDLKKQPDSMASFYFWKVPQNYPASVPWKVPVSGSEEQLSYFKRVAGDTYPSLATYSFDYGDAHFLMLDGNPYVRVYDPTYRNWVENNLAQSKAKWKIVCFHQQGIQTSSAHYEEQRMRSFSPMFEKYGVDVVFGGHIHNYQRSKPLKFIPDTPDMEAARLAETQQKTRDWTIDGKFIIDEQFDGKNNTKPDGIVYFVTGAGGAPLNNEKYKPEEFQKRYPKNWAPFNQTFVSDKHSFTRVSIDGSRFEMKQIDEDGNTVDSMVITK